jgi:hypothetical protein
LDYFVLIGLVIAAAVLAASPLAVLYFHEPKVEPVMQCLALRAILGGLENIGTINFRRDLKFGNFFAYNVYPSSSLSPSPSHLRLCCGTIGR